MKFPVPRPALDQNVILLGKTRSGKSSTMRVILETVLDEKKPMCLITPKDDWWGLKLGADGKSAGYPVVAFGGKHADLPINENAGRHIAELITSGNRPCIITLAELSNRARAKFFIEFSESLFKTIQSPLYLGIDECHNFVPKGKMFDPQQAEMLHWGNRLASEGLGMGVMLLSASQRPQKVHNDFLTSHETLIAKRVIHKADRTAVQDWIDGCGDPAVGKEMVGALASLDRSEAYVWSPEVGFGPKRVTFPFFTTYDSFKPRGEGKAVPLKGWASVDLDAVREKMNKFVEEAKESDPRALKAEIAKLKADAAKAPKPSLTVEKINTPDHKALEIARKEGFGEGYAQGWTEGDRDGFARGAAVALDQGFGAVRDALKAFVGVQFVTGKPPKRVPSAPVQNAAAVAPALARRSVPSPVQMNGSTDGLTVPQSRIMASLAFWKSIDHEAPTREQVAAVAGYRPGSGNFNNLIGSLSSLGKTTVPQPGRLSLNTEYTAPSYEEAQAKLWSIFENPQRRLVEASLAAAGDLARDELATNAGYAPGSGNFNNICGSLTTMDVLQRSGQGRLQISDWAREVLS